ncbi:MAG TPA: FtsH protease activity modulator HflK [Verrucomicrobiae bacterium]|nr:FtsH protease activity modulator HflK [Verrucomicrobiae bacterium]
MAWNEPGGGNRDPWNPGGRRGNDGLPDVDQMLEKLKSRFKGKGPRPAGGGGGGLSTGGAGLLAGAIALLWAASGFYVVDAQERGVVMRFGAFTGISEPGLQWRLPWPIEKVETINVEQVRQVSERSDMLSQDENIVDVELKVQYRVSAADKYLFSQADPDSTLRQVTKSAVREVVGRSKMDFVLSGEGRQEVSSLTQQILQERLDAYDSGLIVTEVNLQNVQAPEGVQDAFLDAIKAREDQVRLTNEAEAYSNDRLPRASGAAARELTEAIAYRDRLIAQATGEADRFSKILTEYRKAPRVTRDRLYLETMAEVLGNSQKVIIDTKKSGPMLYLPLDQLAKPSRGDGTGDVIGPAGSTRSNASSAERARERGGR